MFCSFMVDYNDGDEGSFEVNCFNKRGRKFYFFLGLNIVRLRSFMCKIFFIERIGKFWELFYWKILIFELLMMEVGWMNVSIYILK